MLQIRLQPNEMVILSGPSSSGKSHFAAKHFHPTQVLSSDDYRYLISDLPFQPTPVNHRISDHDAQRLADVSQREFWSISEDAFALLKHALTLRAKHGRLTIVDATSLHMSDIESYVELAAQTHVPVTVVMFDVPLERALAFDAQRDYPRGAAKIRKQHKSLKSLLRRQRDMERLGVRCVYVVIDVDDTEVIIEDNPTYVELGAGLDIMGDGHGLLASRVQLIEQAGYLKGADGLYRHPGGRKLVYLNDESSRGSLPYEDTEYGEYPSIAMLTMMKRHVEAGLAYAVDSNHNYKIWRWLEGRRVTLKHGDETVLAEFRAFERAHGKEKTQRLKAELCAFMKPLPSHLVIHDEGMPRAVVTHAGIRDDMVGKNTHNVYDFCRFGPTDGVDESGKPIRLDWTSEHKNGLLVIWGHVPHVDPVVVRDTINIDQGGFCGHYLTMLRYPEMDIIQEKVPKSFVPPEDNAILKAKNQRFAVPSLQHYMDGFDVETRFGKLHANAEHVRAAIETVSTKTVPIEEMFYVPPTMSPPPSTSPLEDYLEHPREAIRYFESKGVSKLVVEKKHMGSRAILALFRDPSIGQTYFNRETHGTIVSRNNIRFFQADEEQRIVTKLVHDLAPYFEEMATDVLLIDAEILPWNLKAAELIRRQYGLVANASLYARQTHVNHLQAFQASRGMDVQSEIDEALNKLDNARRFHQAFTYYCWDVNHFEGLQIAPFHILAFHHKSNFDETHVWHMEQVKRMAELCDVIVETPYRVLDIHNERDVEDVIRWWTETAETGHEGFVFKPMDFVSVQENGDLVQPAIKVRGQSYLRIIYGMDYLQPENLRTIKKRSAGKKMRNAIREFILSMESVERFLKQENIDRIHECVLAAMSYESEPLDPRL